MHQPPYTPSSSACELPSVPEQEIQHVASPAPSAFVCPSPPYTPEQRKILELRVLVRDIYSEFYPAKLHDGTIDSLFSKYSGDEVKLYLNICTKLRWRQIQIMHLNQTLRRMCQIPVPKPSVPASVPIQYPRSSPFHPWPKRKHYLIAAGSFALDRILRSLRSSPLDAHPDRPCSIALWRLSAASWYY